MPPLVPISLAVAAGILCARAAAAWPGAVVVLGLLAGGLSCLWRRRRWGGVAALLVLWWSVGVLRVMAADRHPCAAAAAWVPAQPTEIAVRGLVVEDPTELFSPRCRP